MLYSQAMQFEPLTEFYKVSTTDARISLSHICLYMALLEQSNRISLVNPFTINRDEVMQAAKLSRKTYNKCMNELHRYGYIRYTPSPNPFLKSLVFLRVL